MAPPPHVFCKIRVELPFNSSCPLLSKVGFDRIPGTFDAIGMGTRYRIFEILRMVDGVVHIAFRRQAIISPAIRKYPGPRLNVFFGDFDQRLCRSILNHAKKKTPFAPSFNTTKHPLTIHSLTSVILPFTKLTFIYFYNHSDTTNLFFTIFHKPIHTNFPAKTFPNNHSWLGHIHFIHNPVMQCFFHPQICEDQNLRYRQPAFGEPTALSHGPFNMMLIHTKLSTNPGITIRTIIFSQNHFLSTYRTNILFRDHIHTHTPCNHFFLAAFLQSIQKFQVIHTSLAFESAMFHATRHNGNYGRTWNEPKSKKPNGIKLPSKNQPHSFNA
ncbi:hypothetical protein AVEN_109389-1 [Araneus ventricosus]|uniref:Uncharacterized protein n=1 Tax=Araneus ventricosus TaxID=182803 RepID=A0A4Y2PXH2_ARAVE|nr:hypothetical protein AVEN_250771-1 [Araneus ventricosus]GBN56598.1 hypothetical protein AVEN_139578-1 [Araneus ventricosus]GBN60825.1 hypothetical protein AVEN_247281-1 [Araneus ventricosus]GBN60861.1 hypothetical protein AVEN_109389-1 [Araneus ventricosus]